jgi:hypothetical protein
MKLEIYRFGEKKVVVFRFHTKIFKDGIRPESFHMVPIFNLAVSNWIMYAIT